MFIAPEDIGSVSHHMCNNEPIRAPFDRVWHHMCNNARGAGCDRPE